MTDTEFQWPSEPIVVVDVEGNGHTPPDLVELAIASFPVVDGDEPSSWLIKPPNPITWQAKRVHGIGNTKVKSSPVWEELRDNVEQQLQGKWFVAHNASVDYGVMKRHLPDWAPIGVIDTLKLSRHVYPDAQSHSLSALLALTGLDAEVSGELHRAGEDARVTALLLGRLIQDSLLTSWPEVCKIAQLKIQTVDETPAPEQGSLW
ncbi:MULTISPECIES: 3'-5' exonuclease [Pseudomonas]|uniref:3'-5' exonuclease n=1 Tax=Pseudomonas TaxID=286 RepID=UPI0005C4062B|nr:MULTISPECIES: 3'-5' exonuclease [Pseudomonas]AJP52234.1 DNA polymerase III subunit epsilon [Pseudomonas simiae]